jgi:hypothetical protein
MLSARRGVALLFAAGTVAYGAYWTVMKMKNKNKSVL